MIDIFIQTIDISRGNIFQFVLPLVLTPRYIPKKQIFDLLSIDGDSQISEDSSLHKSTKRRTKSTKIKNKDN